MFSDHQISELSAPLNRANVRTRKQANRSVSYVESWHVIAEANRIFGFDGWSSETVEINCVAEKDRLIGEAQRPGFGVTYIARVRITVIDTTLRDGIQRDGVGAGHGIDVDLGQAHESAIKEAESDAQKRAFRMFGNVFGLALYDKEQANVADDVELARQKYLDECQRKIADCFPADYHKLLLWWNSEAEHKKRDELLTAPDRLMLQGLVKAKLPPRTGA